MLYVQNTKQKICDNSLHFTIDTRMNYDSSTETNGADVLVVDIFTRIAESNSHKAYYVTINILFTYHKRYEVQAIPSTSYKRRRQLIFFQLKKKNSILSSFHFFALCLPYSHTSPLQSPTKSHGTSRCAALDLLLVLRVVVLGSGLDGVFSQHGAVQLHRRQLQVRSNVRVL